MKLSHTYVRIPTLVHDNHLHDACVVLSTYVCGLLRSHIPCRNQYISGTGVLYFVILEGSVVLCAVGGCHGQLCYVCTYIRTVRGYCYCTTYCAFTIAQYVHSIAQSGVQTGWTQAVVLLVLSIHILSGEKSRVAFIHIHVHNLLFFPIYVSITHADHMLLHAPTDSAACAW